MRNNEVKNPLCDSIDAKKIIRIGGIVMECLKDEKLEEAGLIHKIDTLKIIQEANQQQIKKRQKQLKLLIIVMIGCCFLGQWIWFELFGFQKEMFLIGGVYLLIGTIILLVRVLVEGGNVL